jgi:hypothetical protein
MVEERKANLQSDRSRRPIHPSFSEEISHSLYKPHLTLKADHFEMVPEHPDNLARGS